MTTIMAPESAVPSKRGFHPILMQMTHAKAMRLHQPELLHPPLATAHEPGETWLAIINRLDFAFQPIVNIHTGSCIGYEALLRNVREAGFAGIPEFFDLCHSQGALAVVEGELRRKALEKFARLEGAPRMKLFLNVDNRTFASAASDRDGIKEAATLHGIPETGIVLEISERYPFDNATDPGLALKALKRETFKIALDDFGTGFSGLKMLYVAEPDFLKIDRFFIIDIAGDSKKKLFLSHIVNIAHVLGIEVIAEGVETEREFFICKDIGCDFVQGYLVQKPTVDLGNLEPHYADIEALSRRERRARTTDHRIIFEQIERIEPLHVETGMREVFNRFRASKNHTFLPLVDALDAPLGLIRERELKEFTYSTYGKEIVCNKNFGYQPSHFLHKCPIADIHTPAERILEIFSAAADGTEGVLIVESMRYIGFLSAHSLLKVISEKNLAQARDQNPLSKLPGNNIIHGWLAEAMASTEQAYAFVYFDFDNFKPFNDTYGFRQGDRAILLFAEILTKTLAGEACSIGHVGGDDFFACFKGSCALDVEDAVLAAAEQFRNDVESFYDGEDRERGFILAQDRDGNERRFPLLTVSAAILDLPAGHGPATVEQIGEVIADLKKGAKQSPSKLCKASLLTLMQVS
jgi:EAL domain-containing protein (putative c-di-GMP-specific phosphodiesterase class I)/GGDEF domain-containing protein